MDSSYMDNEVMLHRQLLMALANQMGVRLDLVSELRDRQDAMMARISRGHRLDARIVTSTQKVSPLPDGIDRLVMSLNVYWKQQFDLLAIDSVDPKGKDDLELENATIKAREAVDINDPEQQKGVQARIMGLLEEYAYRLTCHLLKRSHLWADPQVDTETRAISSTMWAWGMSDEPLSYQAAWGVRLGAYQSADSLYLVDPKDRIQGFAYLVPSPVFERIRTGTLELLVSPYAVQLLSEGKPCVGTGRTPMEAFLHHISHVHPNWAGGSHG